VTIPSPSSSHGLERQQIVCVELARMAEAEGLNAVALHARTREQGYSGQAQWEWIAAIKQAVGIPVIATEIFALRRMRRHGGADRMRRGDDRARGAGESVDFRQMPSTRQPACTSGPRWKTVTA